MGQVRFWRLPWVFEAPALQEELARIGPEHWQSHFNTDYHDGGWSGLALISGNGDAARLYAAPDELHAGRDTALLAQCPAMRSVLAQLPFTIQSARLLKLAPGSHIREHSDPGIGLDEGSIRLHVPIVSAPGVEFYLDGVRVPMAEGECWYLDFGLPHRVQNGGTRERVHLVVDCTPDDRLRAMLPSRDVGEALLREIGAAAVETSQQRFERFRDQVLRSPELQAALRDVADIDAFMARVTALGAASGLSFSSEDVRAAMHAGRRAWFERNVVGAVPRQLAVEAPAPSSAEGLRLEDWIPALAYANGDSLTVELIQTGHRRYTEPFFEDSIGVCMRLPFHSTFRQRLDIAELESWLASHPGLEPSGFVFHMSRCGSTLLSQVLAASPASRVISEPGPLDAALRAGGRPAGDPLRARWLRTMLGMLGQPVSAQEQHYYLKFDSWHSRNMPLIRRCYPQVPWVFLMRDPVEVIVSHLRRPGAQMVPGMLGFTPPGVDLRSAVSMPRAEYCARILGGICAEVLAEVERDSSLGLIIDYPDLQAALATTVLPHLGMDLQATTEGSVSEALQRDAKSPSFAFQPDTESKQREATDDVRAAVERWVLPDYRRLKTFARRSPP